MSVVEFWRVDNTGWSGGTSWFKGDRRFETAGDALRYCRTAKKRFDQDTTLWRVAHVTIQSSEQQTVTIESYTEIE